MISAVVLTQNEESTIGSTMTSLSWCDEVLIIDDNSIDATVSLAKAAGGRVIKRKLDDNFAAQRNFGLEQAKGEWVLFIDADEIVPEILAKEVKKVISKGDFSGYKIQRVDYFLQKMLKHGETGNIWLTRLGKKDSGHWDRAIHETWTIDGKVGKLSSPLLHYPHENLADFLRKINYYTTVNARVFFQNGASVSWFGIILYPAAKFIKNYLLLTGFLDGMPGLIHAIVMSFHSFLTRAKLFMLKKA